MAVNIAEDHYLFLLNLSDIVHFSFGVEHLWVQVSARVDPLSIQIDTGQ